MRLFFLKQVHWPLVSLTMNANVGDGCQPDLSGGIDSAEVIEVETIQEIFFDIPDSVFDAAFFVAFADITSGNSESPVSSEVEVARIEYRRATDSTSQDSGAQVIDHDLGRATV